MANPVSFGNCYDRSSWRELFSGLSGKSVKGAEPLDGEASKSRLHCYESLYGRLDATCIGI